MANIEEQRKQREKEAYAREEREREERRKREERVRSQHKHEEEQQRWTDLAVKVQKGNRQKEMDTAEAKHNQLLKQLDEKKLAEKQNDQQ